MKIHECDICGESDAVEVPYARLYTGDQPIHICKGCGLVYVKARRSAEEVADHWSTICYAQHYTALIPAVKARLLYVADYLNAEVGLAGKGVLDLGAGEGHFAELLKNQYEAKVFGVEPSENNCRRMKELGIECFQGTVERFVEKCEAQAKFDVVTITWTLENCVDPRFMLQVAREALKPGGKVVVATGSRILVPFKKPLHLYLNDQRQDLHSFRFSANTLTGLLASCGLRASTLNRYLDSDVLVVIAEPGNSSKLDWTRDDYLKVHGFFERWHQESLHYR
jgi:2-polyprenyl-3-methyl-5-hydroxy-6-metoxy-1,4-benzoquinol methylase